VAGLFVLVAAVLVLGGPRLDAGREALRHPLAWASMAGPDQAGLMAAGLLGWLVLLWLAAGLILTTMAAAPGAVGRAAEAVACRLVPASVRRITAGVLGLSLTASVAACSEGSPTASLGSGLPVGSGRSAAPLPAAAAGSEVDWPLGIPIDAGRSGAGVVGPAGQGAGADGNGARPAGSARQTQPSTGPRQRAGAVVVAAGECLWVIAARQLPAGASPADVAAETQRWYAANAAVIGANPDLLRPGQVLAAPADQY
jgi:hypothetical protein